MTSATRVETPSGIFFVDANRDKKMLNSLSQNGAHQGRDVSLLASLLPPDAVVVDVGAHVGTFSIPLSRYARTVYAIEPFADTYQLLVRNIAENGIVNIVALNSAVSDHPQTLVAAPLSENLGGTMFFAEGSGERTAAQKLSSLISSDEQVSLIKIDVEGMELAVLEGAREIIARDRPLIFIEINKIALDRHGVARRKIESFFQENGYLLFRPFDGSPAVRFARLFSLYQGAFFDCLAVPADRVTFVYVGRLHFFVFQLRKAFTRLFTGKKKA